MDNEQFPGSFFGPPTLVDLLRHRAHHQARMQAYTFLADGEQEELVLTYAELDRQARALASRLAQLNLQGERALLLYPAGLEFIVGFFGCLYAGVVAVPAYPPRMNRSLDRIHSISLDAEARVALTTTAVHERVLPLLDETPDLKRLTWLATDRPTDGLEDAWRRPDVDSGTLAFLQYTSGSTGTPKGVMLRHSNLLHNCAVIAHAFEHTRSSRCVFWLPCYHDMGLVGGILAPLYQGCPNVLMSPMAFLQRPFRWLQAISRYRGTTSGGPNFAYDLCIRKITPEQRAKLDLSCWSVAFNGAEPVRGETLDRFAEVFEPCGFRREAFYPCYGLAEATLLVSAGLKAQPPVVRAFDSKALENRTVIEAPILDIDEGARRLVGSGQELADETIVIADPETLQRCGPGQVGEIWVANPSVAQGYWRRREETQHTFGARLVDSGDGPFLRTGDLGFFQDGELFVAGRLKDLIIIRGLNHYPHDI
ncbi:MAG: fatty acyl-AMP ligase, partial [Pirellulales bacterium]